MADDAVATQNEPSLPPGSWPPDTLDQRLRRLEDAIASLQDTRPLEDRITERVTQRLQGRPASGVADKVMERRPSPPPTAGNASPPVPPAPVAVAPPPVLRQPWLLFDLIAELRAMVRMFFDVRYHVGWSTRLTVLVLLPLLLLSRFWLPLSWVPVAGPVFDKLVDLLLAFVIYKALSREAHRYLQTRAAYPPFPPPGASGRG